MQEVPEEGDHDRHREQRSQEADRDSLPEKERGGPSAIEASSNHRGELSLPLDGGHEGGQRDREDHDDDRDARLRREVREEGRFKRVSTNRGEDIRVDGGERRPAILENPRERVRVRAAPDIDDRPPTGACARIYGDVLGRQAAEVNEEGGGSIRRRARGLETRKGSDDPDDPKDDRVLRTSRGNREYERVSDA